ncbi:hypothetical protein DIE14_27590 [Burkholderia sp. Bp9017]|nr:hypothetical protein DIE14_27590 [Burkholderia sp. Bp9017]
MTHPLPASAGTANLRVGNEPLLAQSDHGPVGPPPKNPPLPHRRGALRIGSGEARVQSTVSSKIINPSK